MQTPPHGKVRGLERQLAKDRGLELVADSKALIARCVISDTQRLIEPLVEVLDIMRKQDSLTTIMSSFQQSDTLFRQTGELRSIQLVESSQNNFAMPKTVSYPFDAGVVFGIYDSTAHLCLFCGYFLY